MIRSDGFAGVERYVSRLAGQQADEGDEVIVIGGDQHRMASALHGSDKQVGLRCGDSMTDVVAAVTRLSRGADVVHAHMTAAELGAVLRVPRRRQVPLISTRHFASRRGTGRLGRVAGGLAAWAVDGQIAVSHYVADHIEGSSTVVHPGVDRAPDATPAATRERVVLVVQRLEVEKQTDVAVRAFAASPLPTSGWRLQLAGDGARRGALTALAGQLGVAGATDFLGVRDDIPELMSRAAILLASPPAEPLGLSVLEAMAAGLPVVASAAGGHLETLAADPSTMFPPGDAAAAAVVLTALAEDPRHRDVLAAAGQQRQRTEFTLTAQAAGTRAVYLDLLSR
ncbi:MAG: glycosyltransferase family 4 protein [Propionibacteriaceae bacterium]